MAENAFLSGMRVEQFIKSNNEQLKDSLSTSFNVVGKGVSDLIRISTSTQKTQSSIDTKLSGIGSLNKTISKMVTLQEKKSSSDAKSKDASVKTLSSFISKQNATMRNLVNTLSKRNTKEKVTKDYFKREDANQDTEDLLTSINKGINRLSTSNKQKENGLLGLFGGVSKLLGGAGLLGFLLTGNKNLLMDAVKPFASIFKTVVTKGIVASMGVMKGAIVPLFTGGAKAMVTLMGGGIKEAMKSMLSTVVKAVGGMGAKNAVMASVSGGAIAKIAQVATQLKGVGGALAKFGVNEAGKRTVGSVAKAGLGVGLKGLKAVKNFAGTAPGVGTLVGAGIGAGFAIPRLMQGDLAGAGMEVASGALGAYGLPIQAALIARDMGAFGGVPNKNGDVGGDNTTYPKDYIYNQNLKNGFITSEQVKKKNYSWFTKAKDAIVKKLFKQGDIDGDHVGATSSGYRGSLNQLKASKYGKYMLLNSSYKPDLYGLKGDFVEKLQALSEELYLSSGGTRKLMVNSGKRGGGGAHGGGYAADINVTDENGNVLKGDSRYVDDNLLNKYGLHTPLKYWKSLYNFTNNPNAKNENWHVEPYPGEDMYGGPRNSLTEGQDYRFNTLFKGNSATYKTGTATADKGGDYNNLPSGKVDKKKTSNAPMSVTLSDKDIEKLAFAISKSVSKVTPKAEKPTVVPAGVGNGRGL